MGGGFPSIRKPSGCQGNFDPIESREVKMKGHPYQVIITDCDHGSIQEEQEEFDRIGAELILAQVQEEKDLILSCKKADGLLNQYARLTRRVLENLPECKVVARYGVGVDSVDLRAATDLGIVVANVPDYCMDEVANQTIAMLLTLIRKTSFFDQKVKSGQWDFRSGIPIYRTKEKPWASSDVEKSVWRWQKEFLRSAFESLSSIPISRKLLRGLN
jgi:hypothetical protein